MKSAEVYEFWHVVWTDYLNEHYREQFLRAGLADHTFTERVPDVPGGKGQFNYGYGHDGSLYFMEEEGKDVIEYDSYALGIQMLADENCNVGEQIKNGNVRFIRNGRDFAKIALLRPLQREAYRVAIEAAKKKFDLELPKYW